MINMVNNHRDQGSFGILSGSHISCTWVAMKHGYEYRIQIQHGHDTRYSKIIKQDTGI